MSEIPQSNNILIAGCAPNSGNLGVSALFYSVVEGLLSRGVRNPVTAFGYGNLNEIRRLSDQPGAATYRLYGMNHSRRFYSPHSTSSLSIQDHFGLTWSRLAKLFERASLLLDISGGDSFSDIYGEQRLSAICCPKERMMKLAKPFILLPQTYGPFKEKNSRDRATRIVRAAKACWARDRDSFDVLKDLLGSDFDVAIHRQGVDVAFQLPTHAPSPSVASQIESLRANQGGLIGLNISGLVYNTPEQSKAEFQLKADYRQVVHDLVQRLLEQSEHRIVLVSHVFGGANRDSDPPAASAVYQQLTPQQRERVWVAPAFSDPREIKWLISQCDWFCGTRMHATIAGLSSGVPTASIAYSMKTRGVFESCGIADQVIDPRHLDTEEGIARTVQSFHDRETTRKRLAEALPATLAIAKQQMDDIAELCKGVGSRQ